jgi:hypothetical protein
VLIRHRIRDVQRYRVSVSVVTDTAVANVPPFGNCTSLNNPQMYAASQAAGALIPQPCQPVLSDWSPGSARVKIGAAAALDSASQCTCTWGRVVTVTDVGQAAASVQ